MVVIGVTGTDGKTTTCNLLYEVMKQAGIKVGVLSTVSGMGLHTTNPGPEILQPWLLQMKKEGMTHVIIEVTSHGIDQHRIAGIKFNVAVLTNITHEHLDYHKTFENYKKTKMRFMKSADIQVMDYKMTTLKNISPTLVGDYNKLNIAAVEKVAEILKIDKKIVAQVVVEYKGVEGRREEIKNKTGIRVIVDFAHTPNALECTLKQLRTETKRDVIVVFGCTGGRDKTKRPIMGQIAAKLADKVIITSDDTRDERQDDIYVQITAGISQKHMQKVIKENDRERAINLAIGEAKNGDIVLLAGKGHEKTLLINGVELPWSDRSVAEKALAMVR